MGYRHFFHVAGHWFDCNGKAFRRDDGELSVCACHASRLALEGGDYVRCKQRVELVVCPEHLDEERRRMKEAKEQYDRRAAAFGFHGKWARMKALPDGQEKHGLAMEIVSRLFGDGDGQRP